MARLSIVIPALGSPGPLEATLLSVLENRPDDCDILVVNPGTYDDPYDLADEVLFLEQSADAGLVACLNAGVAAGDSDLIHILAPGVIVEAGWTDPVLRHFHHSLTGAVAPLLQTQDTRQPIASGIVYGWDGSRQICIAAESTAQVDGPLAAAAFYRRTAWEAAGGLDAEMGDSHADLDLALTLKHLGYRCQVEPQSHILAKSEHLTAGQPGFETGRCAERLFWRHAPQAGWVASALLHPWTAITDLANGASAIGSFAGRIATWFETGIHTRYADKLAAAPRPDVIEPPARYASPVSLRFDAAQARQKMAARTRTATPTVQQRKAA